MRIFSLFFKKLCQKSIVYWNVTTVNIEPFFSCHSENITVDTHTPNDMSMGKHKTPGEGGAYHCHSDIYSSTKFCYLNIYATVAKAV